MTIIDKYLTKEILKFLGLILVMVISIFLTVDFFEKIDNFIEAGATLSKVLSFFQLRIPFIIVQIAPFSILLAVLIVFGLMNKKNELIALKSSGISIYYLLRPVLFIACIMGILLFLLANIVVPITINKANKIWLEEIKKKSAVIARKQNIWIKGNRSIFHIKYYNPSNQTISGITLYYFDQTFRLSRRVDARSGYFEFGKWVFRDLMEQRLEKGQNDYSITFHKERIEPLEFVPEDFKRVIKKSEEMNLLELLAYIRNVESEGYDATSYRVDLHAKVAFPFICIILSLCAMGIAAKRKMKTGLSLNITYGIGVIFLYWIFYSFCLSIGYGGMLPPFIAAWMAHLIFLCFGVLILMNAES